MFVQDLLGDQLYGKSDPRWNDEEIVQIAQDWNEVRDEINRTQCVSNDNRGEKLRVPGNPWIAARQIERVRLLLEIPHARSEALEHSGERGSLRHRAQGAISALGGRDRR